jgi:predicted nuclease with TOPRIM domain
MENIKISESELAEIRMLQGKFQESIFKLGNLQVEKMQLDAAVTEFVEKEKKLKDEWASLQKLEQGLLDKFIEKYGEGNLNMNDGTFSPAVTKAQKVGETI